MTYKAVINKIINAEKELNFQQFLSLYEIVLVVLMIKYLPIFSLKGKRAKKSCPQR